MKHKPVLERSIAVFEDVEKARQWLASPHVLLGGLTPSEYCNIMGEETEVLRLLDATEQGFPV